MTATIRTHLACPLCGGGLRVRYPDLPDRFETSVAPWRLDECSGCGLGMINPAPAGDQSCYYPSSYLSQEGDASGPVAGGLLSRLERSYRFDQYRYDFRLLAAASGVDVARSASYLDVGCGSGERVEYAAGLGVPHAVGIDRYRFAKQLPRANAELVTSEIVDFRPEERFAVVSMFHVLEHVEEPVAVLRHLGEHVVAEDGVLIVQVPNYGSAERRLFGRRWFGMDAPRHLFQFDERTVRRACEEAGLDVVAVRKANAPLHPVTLVPSLLPALDVQRIWVRPGRAWRKVIVQALWALATAVAIPVAWLQQVTGNASMLTVVARPGGRLRP
ncbi:MAG: Methyltransferase type 11 [Marmoricola sp.]|nr:Methyltransferase type 11 [Marmoricola sp.]